MGRGWNRDSGKDQRSPLWTALPEAYHACLYFSSKAGSQHLSSAQTSTSALRSPSWSLQASPTDFPQRIPKASRVPLTACAQPALPVQCLRQWRWTRCQLGLPVIPSLKPFFQLTRHKEEKANSGERGLRDYKCIHKLIRMNSARTSDPKEPK